MSTPTQQETRQAFERAIASEVAASRRALETIVSNAQEALQRLENVHRPSTSLGPGVVFGRRAVDADAHVARLNVLLDNARAVGLDDIAVIAAFNRGFAGGVI